MNEEKSNMMEDLFRKVLGESEVTPGSEVAAKIMRTLERKEFFRFNVSRFNVWYLGGIAATFAFAGILLFSDPGHKNTSKSPTGTIMSDSSEFEKKNDTLIIIKEVKPVLKEEKRAKKDNDTIVAGTISGKMHEKADLKAVSSKELKSDALSIPVVSAAEAKEGASVLVAGIKSSINRGCVPLYVKFTSTSSKEASLEWNFGDGGTSDKENPEWVFDVAGVYKVTLTVKDEDGREAVTSQISLFYRSQKLHLTWYRKTRFFLLMKLLL